MSDSGKLVHVTDDNLQEVIEAERGILILTKSDCGHCAAYQADIETLLEQGKLAGIAIGKTLLDQRGATHFKQTNPWLSSLKVLPYTLLYKSGTKVDEFAASKGSYLLERVAAAFVTSRTVLFTKQS